MTARDIISVSEIEALLEARIEALAHELLPNGRKEGREWRVGSLAGEAGQSLAVHLGGARCGWWKDFAGGEGGDALKLIAAVLFRGNLGAAIQWAKGWLGLDASDHRRMAQFRVEAREAAERRDAEASEAVARAQASARKRWHQGVPIAGTIVDRYLASRGIDLRILMRANGAGKVPGALRFHPEVQYGYGEGAVRRPAMLGAAMLLDGNHTATHRTWLKADGSAKADASDGIAKAKKVLGPFESAHIPLWKGACGDMTLRDVPRGTDVYVSEGIEDGLTVACADPSLRVIAGISVGNIGALRLPPQLGAVVILAQNDRPGSDAAKAMDRAIARLRSAGHLVKVARTPGHAKDVNELAQMVAA